MKRLWNPSSTVLRYVWGLLSMSLAAQLLTAPLTIHYFGQFPLYFLLSNMLAVPLSGVLMYVAVACLLLSPVPWLFQVLTACLSLCSTLFMGVVQGVGSLPGSVVEGLSLSIEQVVMVYALMVCLLIWLIEKRGLFFRFSLICLLFFQCLFLWEKFVGI
jgi:competence protein ComEC